MELGEEGKKKALSLRENVTKWRKIEEELAADLDVEEGYVLLDVPPVAEYREAGGRVIINGELTEISRASPLIRILRKAQEELLDMAIYVPREHLEEFRKLQPESYLG